jgi:hypothetical protein
MFKKNEKEVQQVVPKGYYVVRSGNHIGIHNEKFAAKLKPRFSATRFEDPNEAGHFLTLAGIIGEGNKWKEGYEVLGLKGTSITDCNCFFKDRVEKDWILHLMDQEKLLLPNAFWKGAKEYDLPVDDRLPMDNDFFWPFQRSRIRRMLQLRKIDVRKAAAYGKK